jgi:WD40 repeat protein
MLRRWLGPLRRALWIQVLLVFGFPAMTLPAEGKGLPSSPGRTDLHGDPLPEGALSRFGTVRLRHPDRVRSVAVGPNGKVLASLDDHGLLCIWDFATGRLLRRFACPRGPYGYGDRVLAFSPSGDCLAAASGKDVYLVDPGTGLQRGCLSHGEWIVTVQYSPDGKNIASGSASGTVRVWDAPTGKELHFLSVSAKDPSAPPNNLFCLTFSPDGKTLLANGRGKALHTWDTRTGELVRSVGWSNPEGERELPSEVVVCAVIAPDGKTVAVGTQGTGSVVGGVHLLDPVSGKQLRRLDGLAKKPFSLTFSCDGSLLAAAVSDPASVQIWDVASGRRVLELPSHASKTVCFTPDRRTVVSGGDDSAIRMWDLESRTERGRPAEHLGSILAVAFAPDGSTVATTGSDRTIRLWDSATGRSRLLLPGGESLMNVPEVRFFPDGRGFLCLREPHLLSVCDIATGREVRKLTALKDPVRSFGVSPDGKLVAVRTLDDKLEERWLHLLDAATGSEIHQLRDPATVSRSFGVVLGFDGPLRFSMDGKCVASGSHGTIRQWDVVTGKERCRLEGHKAQINHLNYFPGGRLLVSEAGECDFSGGSVDHTNRLWDAASGRQLWVVEEEDSLFWLEFAPDGRTFAAVRKDDMLVFETASGTPLRWLSTSPRISDPLFTRGCRLLFAFSPDCKRLAAGYGDGIALVWYLAPQGSQVPAGKANPDQLRNCWANLAGEDAPRAHCAIYTIAHLGVPALAFLRERLKPAPKDFADRMRQSIAGLDNDDFRTREQAMRDLTRLGPDAVLPLHAALDAKPSVEARSRIEALLKDLHPWYIKDPETLRTVRAIWALQLMATPEARALLDTLAAGAPEARITQEAQAALGFLDRNRKP